MGKNNKIFKIIALAVCVVIVSITAISIYKIMTRRLIDEIDNIPLEFTTKALLNLDKAKINSIAILYMTKKVKEISSKERIALYSSAITKSYKYPKADESIRTGLMIPVILRINVAGAKHGIFLGYGYDGSFYCNAQVCANNSFESKDLYNLIKADTKELGIDIDR